MSLAPPTVSAPPQLAFAVAGAQPERHGAAPAINLTLSVVREGGGPVRSILLDVQLRIAARARDYAAAEQARLVELFGTPERWSSTLRTLPWTRAVLVVPAFDDATEVTLPVACSYDLEVNADHYASALQDGEIPLELLFSGSVFYGRPLQVARIGWDREATYRLPLAVWRAALDRHYPGAAWLRLDRATFDRLRDYKARHGLHTLDDAIGRLLDG